MAQAPAASVWLHPGEWTRRAASLTGNTTSTASGTHPRLRIGRRAQRAFAGLQIPNSHLSRCRIAHVKSGEADGCPKTEDVIFDEETLQRDLEIAIQEEDYARAAKLRDDLRILQEDIEASVLAVNACFYNAFKNRDLAMMYSIWAKGDDVYVVHPAAGRIYGYDVVMQSWEMVCNADYEFPLQIDLKNIEVHVRGDLGYVSCMGVVKTEGSSWGKQIATNVFEKIDGKWFICIHHASHIDE